MKNIVWALALACMILSLSCTTALLMDATALREELGLVKMPTQDDYPDADGVVLLDRQDVEMEIDGNNDLYTFNKVHKIQKLFKNLDAHASVQINLYDGEALTDIQARTIKPDGSNIILRDHDFYTISGEGKGSVLYSDVRKIRFTFPSVEKGCIVEYRYTKKTQRGFWYDTWYIQNYLPTLRNEYVLTVPIVLMDKQWGLGWTWRYKSYNYPDLPQPVQSPVKNERVLEKLSKRDKVSFTWSLKDIPAFEEEVNMPPHSLHMAYVRFSLSEWANWDNIAAWYYNRVFDPQLIITDQIKTLAERLTGGSISESEKIQNIYKYIQGVRYVAIELGAGSLQPTVPQLVLMRQYGDCKDKAILLISLLRSVGVTAKPILVLTASEGVLDPEFPTWNFNHMIVKAEGRDHHTYWIDPTVNYCGLGELPWQDEGIDVLVLNENGTASIEHTPNASCDQNVTTIEVAVNVDPLHETTFKVKMTYKGEKNFRSRALFSDYTEKELRDYCKELIVDDYLNATVKSCSFSNFDSLSCDLTLSFDFTVPDALRKQGDLYFLSIDPFKLFTDMSWLAKEKRIYPIDLEYPFTVKKRIAVNYPQENFMVRNIPEKIQLSNDDMVYKNDFSSGGDHQLIEEESFSVRQPYIPAQKYAEVRKLFETVKSRSTEKLIFTSRN
ncbi:MAG: DUF3857 domain-containing protein [Ignavibacteriae bacterium]|nr:DUF3857 domain-containing protein [Ignavibacteria bacterium]MBI3365472.1 DUF3857 domain-containing protein [Ignavibacteriota bacterium]